MLQQQVEQLLNCEVDYYANDVENNYEDCVIDLYYFSYDGKEYSASLYNADEEAVKTVYGATLLEVYNAVQ